MLIYILHMCENDLLHAPSQPRFLSLFIPQDDKSHQAACGWVVTLRPGSMNSTGTKIIQNWVKNTKNVGPSYQGDLFEGKPEKDMVF